MSKRVPFARANWLMLHASLNSELGHPSLYPTRDMVHALWSLSLAVCLSTDFQFHFKLNR